MSTSTRNLKQKSESPTPGHKDGKEKRVKTRDQKQHNYKFKDSMWQMKSFLPEALPLKCQDFLAYTQIDTYENSLRAVAEFETELNRMPYAGGRSSGTHNGWAMDVDQVKINQFRAKGTNKGNCYLCNKEGH
jgi:hypothetical protein